MEKGEVRVKNVYKRRKGGGEKKYTNSSFRIAKKDEKSKILM